MEITTSLHQRLGHMQLQHSTSTLHAKHQIIPNPHNLLQESNVHELTQQAHTSHGPVSKAEKGVTAQQRKNKYTHSQPITHTSVKGPTHSLRTAQKFYIYQL